MKETAPEPGFVPAYRFFVVVRHAGASSIGVSLSAKQQRIILSIEDDGQGLDPAQFSGSGERDGRLTGYLTRNIPAPGEPAAGSAISMPAPLITPHVAAALCCHVAATVQGPPLT